jgi:FixJ family two-component response regulator
MTGKVVGIVENDPEMRGALERLLTAHGFVAKVYVSAEEFPQAPVSDMVCLVLDIQLDGMSGIELRHRLVATHRALPVIFMTAFDNQTTRQRVADAGRFAYLVKPFGASSLIEAIDKATAN